MLKGGVSNYSDGLSFPRKEVISKFWQNYGSQSRGGLTQNFSIN